MASADSPQPITKDFLIIGEGTGDASFATNLCEVRAVTHFQIEDARGESKIVTQVSGLKSRKGFDRLQGLLVVADNDETPEDNFSRVRNYLKDARFPAPNQPLTVARINRTGLAVVVMMVPFEGAAARKGCLETLLLRSLEGRDNSVRACIDAYCTCLGNQRTKNQDDKLRIRSFIAAKYGRDPNLALAHALSPSKALFDLTHTCFDEIYDFLRDFPNLCS